GLNCGQLVDGQKILKLLAETSCAPARDRRRNLSLPKTEPSRGAPRGARGTGQLGLQAGFRLGGRTSGAEGEHEIAVSGAAGSDGPLHLMRGGASSFGWPGLPRAASPRAVLPHGAASRTAAPC